MIRILLHRSYFLFFILFLVSQWSWSQFTLSGSTITHAGTTTSLSGLSGISGVSVVEVLDQKIYTLTDRVLIIQGTLTTATNTVESLILDGTSTLNVQGTFNFGHDYEDEDGSTQEHAGLKSKLAFNHSGGSWNNPRLWVSGTFNGVNCEIDASQTTIRTDTGGHFKLKNSSIYNKDGTPNDQFRVQGNNADVTFDNVTAIGISYQFFNYSGTNSLKRYNPIDTDDGLVRGGNGSFLEVLIDDFGGKSLHMGGNNQVFWMKNPKNGTEIKTKSFQTFSTQGLMVITGTINFDFKDIDDNAIQNAKIFAISDATTGNDSYKTQNSKYDFNKQSVYFESTNSSGTLANDLEIIMGEVYVNNTTSEVSPSNRNGRTDDVWNYNVWHYSYLPISFNQDMSGTGLKRINRTLNIDTNISESNVASITNYTTIENLDQLYDYAKYWKQLNASNIQVPTTSDYLISGSGSQLSLPDNWDLVVDGSAGSIFTVNTSSNTITVKSSTLLRGDIFESIRVGGTGTITAVNSATLEHGYIDSSGTHKYVHLDWNQNTKLDVFVENLSTNTDIVSGTVTEEYKGHFLMPSPAPTSGIRANIEALNGGYTIYEELIPQDGINFIRVNIVFTASEERQRQMLYLARKIVQKNEAMLAVLNASTPSITISTTTTNTNKTATNENQVAILELLQRILLKTSANRETFQD